MNPLILGPVLEIGRSLIERLFPDPAQKAKAELDMMVLLQTQDLQKVLGQLEVNAKEAASPHLFVAGWRPFVGWCCGLGFLWAAIGQNVFAYVAAIKGWPAPPEVDTEVLLYVLGGMLGLGTLRSVEKVKGAA
jgi:Holin of 3TMs, for gene-transfer release